MKSVGKVANRPVQLERSVEGGVTGVEVGWGRDHTVSMSLRAVGRHCSILDRGLPCSRRMGSLWLLLRMEYRSRLGRRTWHQSR